MSTLYETIQSLNIDEGYSVWILSKPNSNQQKNSVWDIKIVRRRHNEKFDVTDWFQIDIGILVEITDQYPTGAFALNYLELSEDDQRRILAETSPAFSISTDKYEELFDFFCSHIKG